MTRHQDVILPLVYLHFPFLNVGLPLGNFDFKSCSLLQGPVSLLRVCLVKSEFPAS